MPAQHIFPPPYTNLRIGADTMTKQALAVGLILILLIMAYLYATRQVAGGGGGVYPQVRAEAYLYYDPSSPSPTLQQAENTAKGFGAGSRLATPGDLAYYASMGGHAGWYGATTTGDILSVANPIYTPTALVMGAPSLDTPYGIWVYGPKGSLDMKNISPFSCSSWFQPALKGS
jgi:hypothetical protein